jgi:hypothetical protein
MHQTAATLGVGNLSLAGIPPGRTKSLARHAAAARAQAVARMPPERRIATLLAFAREFEIRALDDALDVFDLLITEIFRTAKNTGQKERIRTLGDLDKAALRLKTAVNVLLDDSVDGPSVRKEVFAHIPKAELQKASATVEVLARPEDDNYYPELVNSYRRVRRFLPTLLGTITFSGTQAAEPLLSAFTTVHFLGSLQICKNTGQYQNSAANSRVERLFSSPACESSV